MKQMLATAAFVVVFFTVAAIVGTANFGWQITASWLTTLVIVGVFVGWWTWRAKS